MDISKAKEEIKRAVAAYTTKTAAGTYRIPTVRQRPVLLMGPPGIGKTAVVEQVPREMKNRARRIYNDSSHKAKRYRAARH
jgi:MoxR-like ATPase